MQQVARLVLLNWVPQGNAQQGYEQRSYFLQMQQIEVSKKAGTRLRITQRGCENQTRLLWFHLRFYSPTTGPQRGGVWGCGGLDRGLWTWHEQTQCSLNMERFAVLTPLPGCSH